MDEKKGFEIEVLNLEDLDVDELEQRLELASGSIAQPDGWVCWCDRDWCDCDVFICTCNAEAPCPCVSYVATCSCDGNAGCDMYGCGGGTQIP
jgi:hypothetical protein